MDVIDYAYVDVDGNKVKPRDKVAVKFRVVVSYDNFTSLSDFSDDEMTDATKEAYRNNDWYYVNITVTPVINDVEIDLPQVIGGVEWGTSPDWDEDLDLDHIIKDYAADLVYEVRKDLISFRDALNSTIKDIDNEKQ